MKERRFVAVGACLAGLLLAVLPLAATPEPQAAASTSSAQAPACPKIWVDHEAAVEEYLKTAEVDRVEEVPIGVTKPKRAYFKNGGPVKSAAWKPLRPGIHRGFWESYKSEIAAYELDKLLGMDMVPPAVERRVDGDSGAIVMWVENTHGWKINEPVRGPDPVAWDRQVIRMKMFDQLIANTDRNQGNLLYDDEYHLILIDHSRAFTSTKDLSKMSKPTRIDKPYWDAINGLTYEQLEGALIDWIGKREIRAILERRDKMAEEINKMVAQRGEAVVFIK